MARPVVTICTPSFNRADLIRETLDSLIAQTFPNWEIIVVDDGSTDNSTEIVREYSTRDPRIRLLTRDREPKGACTCRNIAVEKGGGRYVLFLDTDDLLAPFCLAQRVAVLESQPDLDFAVFSMLLFTGSPSTADRFWNIDSADDDLLRLLKLDPVCQGTGTLWRRESFIRAGMWNEKLRVWQDVDLHLRAFSGAFKYEKRLDLPADAFLRETTSSLSRGDYQSPEKLESRSRVTREAVAVLRNAGRADLIPHVRYFCSSVALGAAASGNFSLAREMISWGESEGVLSSEESRNLRFAVAFRRWRIDRLGLIRRLREKLTSQFVASGTLGVVPAR
ncbi:MAG: glycosyltransferase family 2 protein [Gemmatimonadaceae bacterium]